MWNYLEILLSRFSGWQEESAQRAIATRAGETINLHWPVTDLTGYASDKMCLPGIAGLRDALGVPLSLGSSAGDAERKLP